LPNFSNYEHRELDPCTSWQDAYYNLNRTEPLPSPTMLLPNLFIGGTPDDDLLVHPGVLPTPWKPSVSKNDFDACVTLTPLAGPAGTGVAEFRFTFPDSKTESPSLEMLASTIDWAYFMHRSGARVLVRCHAGLNRSGLIAVPLMTHIARTLSFTKALSIARENRHDLVLSNELFQSLAANLCFENS
jgi:hypothetical protein